MVVRERKYWYCESPACAGPFEKLGLSPPRCPNLGCERPMALELGKHGRWVGRWFWSCPLAACTVQPTRSGFEHYNVTDPLEERNLRRS